MDESHAETKPEQHPPEQALAKEARRLAAMSDLKSRRWMQEARALLPKLAEENEELRRKLFKLGYDFAAEVTEIRERAAADCVRLEGALREIAGRDWRDEGGRIAAALARDGLNGTGRFSPAEAEDEQHARAATPKPVVEEESG